MYPPAASPPPRIQTKVCVKLPDGIYTQLTEATGARDQHKTDIKPFELIWGEGNVIRISSFSLLADVITTFHFVIFF